MKGSDAFLRFRNASKEYFSDFKQDIAHTNMALLHKVEWIFIAMLLFYSIVAGVLFHNQALNTIYLIFFGLSIASAAGVSWYSRHGITPGKVKVLCVLFILMVMCFVIIISIFPFPDRPGIFFPIVYLLMPAIFIFPILEMQLLLSMIQIAYIVLSYIFKSPQCWGYDVFSAFTAWLVGFFLSYLILDLRLKEHRVHCELERISTTDELTGLLNRRALDRFLRTAAGENNRDGAACSILMLDIDRFKSYNDIYGHLEGDRCLAEVAAVLHEVAEAYNAQVFRYGGEEFVCVICHEGEKALGAAADMLKQIRRRNIKAKPDASAFVTISIGVSVWRPQLGEPYMQALQRADTALYHAKARGRDCAVLYEQCMEPQDSTTTQIHRCEERF